jgi:hypothetical protein
MGSLNEIKAVVTFSYNLFLVNDKYIKNYGGGW